MRIRVVPTASGKYAVQVVSKRHGVLSVHKHIGSYGDASERSILYEKAKAYIAETTGQGNLLDLLSSCRPSDVAISENRPLFVYRILSATYDKLGLGAYADPLIKDLVIVARIFRPASKREIQEILSDLFDRQWSLVTIYRRLKRAIDSGAKDAFQKALLNFAGSELRDSLRLVFYDVTTLYFESAIAAGIRSPGFSKDHRPQDTQIVVGLVVNRQGFPLYFDVFHGRVFEGRTLASVIKNIQRLLDSPELVVVADSAMLSQENTDQLARDKVGFIVGARTANLPRNLLDKIVSRLGRDDGKTVTVTYRGQRLICQYLQKRADKDKSDREKQLTRARAIVDAPAEKMRRYRFVKIAGQTLSLNMDLIARAEKLDGIKGYLTNTQLPEATVIERYHDLWRIERAFRLTKSDLEARPIFHHLDEAIKAHLVIVFAGLAIATS